MPIPRSIIAAGLLTVLAAGASTVFSGCGEQNSPAPAPQVGAPSQPDPRAEKVLDSMRAFYRNLPRVEGKSAAEFSAYGQRSVTAVTFQAERPNSIAIRLYEGEGDDAQYALVSDGTTLHQFVAEPLNAYSQEEAPANYTQMLTPAAMGNAEAADQLLPLSPHLLVLGLLGGDGFDRIVSSGVGVSYLGTDDVNGARQERVRLHGKQINFDLWIQAGEQPWLTRIDPDPSPMVAEMREMLGEQADQMLATMPKITITFSEWSIPQEIPAGAFAYEAPAGAERVDSLAAFIAEKMGGDAEDGHSAIVGHPAPPLDLELLGGGSASLAAHEGKVVILDFWATWCGPCVRAMPIITSVANRYKDQGVVLYAINVQESPEQISAFLKQHNLDVSVPMDVSGAAAERYAVRGIPQTVLIGKDGTVQAVHVGLLPNLEEQLSSEVETLLAGNRLVPAPAGPQEPGNR
jgi:thiol-disulfide isomerase/thioredoxin